MKVVHTLEMPVNIPGLEIGYPDDLWFTLIPPRKYCSSSPKERAVTSTSFVAGGFI
jgi:hypothetical protein